MAARLPTRSSPATPALGESITRMGDTVPDTLEAVAWPVRTERLVLRPATTEDVEAIWCYRRLEAVSHWLPRLAPTLEGFRRHQEEPSRMAKTLVMELEGRVIGDLMLAVEDAWAQAEVADRARSTQVELGWVLHPDHAGRGLATEAVRELIRICFDDLGAHRVTASSYAGNETSWRLMERVGMRRESYGVRESLHRSGEWLDSVGYALLAEEWRASR